MSYLQLTFHFVQKVLLVNQNSNDKLDGIVAMKIFITIFECLPGQIDHALPNYMGVLLAELSILVNKKKPVQKYLSMIL